jgi:hypothetical protein
LLAVAVAVLLLAVAVAVRVDLEPLLYQLQEVRLTRLLSVVVVLVGLLGLLVADFMVEMEVTLYFLLLHQLAVVVADNKELVVAQELEETGVLVVVEEITEFLMLKVLVVLELLDKVMMVENLMRLVLLDIPVVGAEAHLRLVQMHSV